MKSKWARGPIFAFLWRFVVVFGLLIAPWPGWNALYAQYFQGLGQMMFSSDDGKRFVNFGPVADKNSVLDTQITLGNRELEDSRGHAPVRSTGIDSRSIGWVPTALTVALVAASPIPWRRRLVALASGLVLIHLFILFTVQTWIWNNASGVSLLSLSAFWQNAADELNYALMTQIGASFSVPVVIWVLVTFRRQDALA
jgi:type IV secretory pathway TrbL component